MTAPGARSVAAAFRLSDVGKPAQRNIWPGLNRQRQNEADGVSVLVFRAATKRLIKILYQ
jgi:hypothetical protein